MRQSLLFRFFLLSLACVFALLVATVWIVTQPFTGSIASQPPVVDSGLLLKHVKFLSIDAHPRNHEEINNLDKAAEYIKAQFQSFGVTMEEQSYIVDGKKYRNLIARFGKHTNLKQIPVWRVIGAHYDTHDITLGADDNASGVAGLIELGRLLAKHPPKRPVELVAFTLEEPPHFRTKNMGAARYVKALQEMRGASNLPVRSINAPRALSGIDFSDHLAFWDADIPALMVTDTSFFRNQHYHLETDTWDRLDYQRMAKVVQGVYALATN